MTIYLFLNDGTRLTFNHKIYNIESASTSIINLFTEINTRCVNGDDKIQKTLEFIDTYIESNKAIVLEEVIDQTREVKNNIEMAFKLSLRMSPTVDEKYLDFPQISAKKIKNKNKHHYLMEIKTYNLYTRPKRTKKKICAISDNSKIDIKIFNSKPLWCF